MVATKPYALIGCGTADGTKAYQLVRFGAMDVTKLYKLIRLGATDGLGAPEVPRFLFLDPGRTGPGRKSSILGGLSDSFPPQITQCVWGGATPPIFLSEGFVDNQN